MNEDEPAKTGDEPPVKIDRRRGMPHLWKPGQSGNPGGRKPGLEKLVRDICADDLAAMTRIMVDMVVGRPTPQTLSDGTTIEQHVKPRDRQEAYKILTDRGWGKPKQTIDMTTDITRGGLNQLDVDALELAALQALDESISKQLDPRARRVIDVTKQSAAVASAARAKAAEGETAPVIAAEPIAIAIVPEIIEPVKVDDPIPEPVPEPVKNIVKHVFQGSANVAFATLNLDSGDVDVVFSSGMRYRFGNFTQALLDEWKLALSPGKWFNAELKDKPKEHPVRKIR